MTSSTQIQNKFRPGTKVKLSLPPVFPSWCTWGANLVDLVSSLEQEIFTVFSPGPMASVYGPDYYVIFLQEISLPVYTEWLIVVSEKPKKSMDSCQTIYSQAIESIQNSPKDSDAISAFVEKYKVTEPEPKRIVLDLQAIDKISDAFISALNSTFAPLTQEISQLKSTVIDLQSKLSLTEYENKRLIAQLPQVVLPESYLTRGVNRIQYEWLIVSCFLQQLFQSRIVKPGFRFRNFLIDQWHQTDLPVALFIGLSMSAFLLMAVSSLIILPDALQNPSPPSYLKPLPKKPHYL